jgi:DNA repair exonuclease SbcCD nuclease subunit
MKILHLADTHLGYSAYRKITKDGVNQRETDVYKSFEKFIDYAISNKVDLVLHAGDLFDSVRPNNRAITVAIQQILRLSLNKIPFIVISGNHEQPKLKETGHIFNIFNHIENVYPIYHEKYEKKIFKIKKKKICIHALPQTNTKESFQLQIQQLNNEKQIDFNILLIHGSVQGIKEFTMNEFNELMIPKKYLESFFNYCALGHYHKFTQVEHKAFYSGSTEALTFADAKEKKGFMELTIENNELIPRFKTLPTRPMIDTEPINCNKLKIDEILTRILSTINIL